MKTLNVMAPDRRHDRDVFIKVNRLWGLQR
jgi:hypothetical protein